VWIKFTVKGSVVRMDKKVWKVIKGVGDGVILIYSGRRLLAIRDYKMEELQGECVALIDGDNNIIEHQCKISSLKIENIQD